MYESKLKFKAVEQTLNRLKNNAHSDLPKSHEEIKEALNKNVPKALTNENPFYINSELSNACSFHVFGSMKTIEFIKQNIDVGQRNYLIDGTFKVAPRNHYQLLIISIEYKNKVIFDLLNQTADHSILIN